MDGPRGRLDDGVVRVGGDARQRYYDSRGYGRPTGGNEIVLAPVEAAHLLYRGDLAAVERPDDEELGFMEFLGRVTDETFIVRFLVYADLRERGFYLSPAREGWVTEPPANAQFVVYERGTGPWDDQRLYPVHVTGDYDAIPVADLDEGLLAVADEESEVTYFGIDHPEMSGRSATSDATGIPADLLADRVLVWDAPNWLFGACFYGQPLAGREGNGRILQLSLIEAAYLARRGVLDTQGDTDIAERGRAVEGERFDRRLAVYATLRERGVVPKTGFKFGADFRVYMTVDSVEDLGHSEHLVRVLPPEHVLSPRDLALDVRMAHGVRKRMVFALASVNAGMDPTFVSVGRVTP